MLRRVFAALGFVFVGCGPAAEPAVPAGGEDPPTVSSTSPAATPSSKTLRYEIVFGDRVAGTIVLVRHADGSSEEDLEFQERGKRPKTHARLELGKDGLPNKLEIQGKNLKMRDVHEVCTCDATMCRWQSGDERGQAPRGFYAPQNISLMANAAMLRLAEREGGAKLLPGGVLRAREVTRTKLEHGGKSITVRAFELSGSNFSPRVEWFDEEGESFAQVDDFGGGVREGWRHALPRLLELQRPLAVARRARIMKEVSHRPAKLALVHARLFDATTKKTIDDATIVIEGGKFVSVKAKGPLPTGPGVEVIDATKKTVLPGLWDMHVHLQDDDGLMNVANGITTVRDLGSEVESALARKKRWDDDTELGPRVVLAGFVDGHGATQGPFKVFADTPEEARAVVADYAGKGFTQLKIYSSVKPELVPVLIAAARAKNMRVSGHVPQGMTSELVVKAGFDELQHIEQLLHDLHGQPTEPRGATGKLGERGADIQLDGPKARALVDLLARKRIVVDPTLNVIEEELTVRSDHPNPTLAPVRSRLPAQVQRDADGGALPVPEGMDERYRQSFRRATELVKRLWERKITLVAGSDAWPGFALHRELELYSEAGIPNAEVLAIATLGAARVMKLDATVGSVTVGKDADCILVDGDPLARMTDVRRVVTVVKRGAVIDAVAARAALSIAPEGK